MRALTPIRGLSGVHWILLLLTACAFPRDPEHTLDTVRNGTLRVGLIIDPPWASETKGRPEGIDVDLVREFAESLDAVVQWRVGSERELLPALEYYRLDLVAGGLTKANPRLAKVGASAPYVTTVGDHEWSHESLGEKLMGKKHVMAVPPGENAFLLELDKFLHQAAPRVIQALQQRG